jgi:hypothetical protein
VSVLLEAFADPECVKDLSIDAWNRLLRTGAASDLLGRLSYLLEDRGLVGVCPSPAWEMLTAARFQSRFVQTRVLLEARRLRLALGDRCDIVLLKGAAYAAAGYPFSRGRGLSDLDILVPRQQLGMVERTLRTAGWQPKEVNAYDDKYYREWMHELPPFIHPDHGIEVDIHHTLLPLIGHLQPRPERLIECAVPAAPCGFRVLCGPDMVLHTAAHLFCLGEIRGGLKDMVDIHLMVRHFGVHAGFWEALLNHALLHDLARPLYYAMSCAVLLFRSPVPDAFMRALRPHGPAPAIDRLMRRLVVAVLTPVRPERREPILAAWLLLARSHLLRMPPLLLASHLARKSIGRCLAGLSMSSRTR